MSATTTDCQAGQNLVWRINLNAGESLTRTFTAVVDSITPPANGTLLSTVVNVNENNGAGVTAEAVVGINDVDGDGIADDEDNCIEVSNPDQRDTSGDGFGNICDPDLNNDNRVDFADLAILKSVFFKQNDDADLSGDGRVDFADLAIMKSMFFGAPGPSALAP